MQRSFYVGDALTEADTGALSLNIPKADAKKLPGKKVIMIEG